MSTAVKRRRGTTVQHSTFTGQNGEVTVDTDKKTLVVHDGAKAGGFPIERIAITPSMYGAKGDGVTDDTAAWQAAVDSALPHIAVDGQGLEYRVTAINVGSNRVIKNARLNTKPGATDMVSPITIGAYNDTALRENIRISNLIINGNRSQQTGIGASEDGGRHGIRVIGNVNNLLIEDCVVTYCASDGLALYSGIGTKVGGYTNAAQLTNITVRNCQFNWNRRHGGSGDSLERINFEKCEFSYNGRDLNTSDALDHGNRGARSGGNLYGNGFDFEAYGVGGAFRKVTMESCVAIQNYKQGVLFYDPTNPGTANFVASSDLVLLGCTIDSGIIGGSGPYAVEFTSAPAYASTGPLLKNITMLGNRLTGGLNLRSCNIVTIDGGFIIPSGSSFYANLDYATNVWVGNLYTAGTTPFTSNSSMTNIFRPVSTTSVPQARRATLASGAELDLGVTRTTTHAVLLLWCKAGLPTGGYWCVVVYLEGGAGVRILSVYNGTQVGTAGSSICQVMTSATNWKLKNNDSVSYDIGYALLNE